jgi:hypothetical protein
MAVSVNTSNTASQVILNVAANAGSLALAADWIQSPMGAGGGAIFGTVHILSKAALSVATDKLLNKITLQLPVRQKRCLQRLNILVAMQLPGGFWLQWELC